MAKLITPDGRETEIWPLSTGFTVSEVSRLVGGPDLLIFPLNSQMLVITANCSRPGPHNAKASNIVRFVLAEDHRVEGPAMFLNSEEFRPLLREFVVSGNDEYESPGISVYHANRRRLLERLSANRC